MKNIQEWIKTNLGLLFVLIVTAIYLIFVLLITDLSAYKTLELNAKGDFLAGVFSPLAFLWLVYGYLQQGQELKLNTQALELQTRELKESVQAQKDMFELAEKQYNDLQDEKTEAAKPKILVTGFNPTKGGDAHNGFDYRFQVKIKNLQVPIQNIKITSSFWSIDLGSSGSVTESNSIRHLGLERGSELDIRFHKFRVHNVPFNGETFKINFEDHNNMPYEQEFKISKNSEGIILIR